MEKDKEIIKALMIAIKQDAEDQVLFNLIFPNEDFKQVKKQAFLSSSKKTNEESAFIESEMGIRMIKLIDAAILANFFNQE